METLRHFWHALRRLFSARATGAPSQPDGTGRRGRQVDDYLDLIRRHPGTRVTTVRLLGRKTTEDNVLHVDEHLETEDDDGNARQVDVYDARQCGSGHLLDQEIRPTCVCQTCGQLMCSMEGCTGWCSACGAACCARHRRTHQLGNGTTVTYCTKCNWLHLWRMFWGLYPE